MKRTYETVHERFPDKQILCAEATGWGKNRGPWFGDVDRGLSHNWLGGPQHRCEAALQWNLVLDHKFGPTLRDDSQATALVTVNTDRYDEARFEREFYALAQMSRAARPGSKRIDASVRAGKGAGLELTELEARRSAAPDAVPSDVPAPDGVTPVEQFPDEPGEELGRVEFTGDNASQADRGLQLRAGMRGGADAVVGVYRFKGTEGGQTVRHADGLAVRVADAAVRRQLRERSYAEQVLTGATPPFPLATPDES